MNFRSKFFLFACMASAFFSQNSSAQNVIGSDSIRLNQIGFYTTGPKKAIILNADNGIFYIQTTDGRKVFTGHISKSVNPAFNSKYTGIADFTALTVSGTYSLVVQGHDTSYPFIINKSALKSIGDGSLKGYYFIRASTDIKEPYAGKWHRTAGHPDKKVLIHPSAASNKRPTGTIISSPGGWYDAGDYNKYIVNSGISTATLLSLYEDYPAYMQSVKLNIPESNNKVPDILDEVLWNLRWMLTMQDPNDGGVYHKLTNAAFDPFIMPDKAVTPRYVVQKSTAATLDFAAVMAQASRIFARFPQQLPGLADSCRKAANSAWNWAQKNPSVLYEQDEMNKKFSPAITTGTYGDRKVDDEFIWAAAELFITTKDAKYIPFIKIADASKIGIPSWGDVYMLGYYSLLRNAATLNNTSFTALGQIKTEFLKFAATLTDKAGDNAYQTVMNKSPRNFNWGSTSNAANQGIALLQAFKLTGDQQYLNYAIANMDYLVGRNGTGYCYLTGFGHKPVMHPHHRPSVADGVPEPVPGLLSGGANPGMQDKIPTPSKVPDEAYVDDDRAYAVNEIAINWNAPFAYLANALQAIETGNIKSLKPR